MSDFNSEPMEETMSDVMELYDLKNLVRVSTCCENLENPSCIDHFFLTNENLCFQDTNAFEAGLSDFHRLAVPVMKTYFKVK